jgi:CMP-N,N'-diacetyllegionaminic acid synthase
VAERNKDLRVLAVIPARGGSKRLPGKNTRELGGKPLIAWSIESAVESRLFCDVLVSTDEPHAADIAKVSGALVPWLRPANLALDETPSIDVVIHALSYYEDVHGAVDAVMLLQPTSPFRTVRTIRQALELFDVQDRVSVVAVSPSRIDVVALGRLDNNGCWHAMGDDERKLARTLFKEGSASINGLVYLSSPDTIRNGSILTDPCRALVVSDLAEALDIDTHDDWKLAEYVVLRRARERIL